MKFLSIKNLMYSYKKARKSRKSKQEVFEFDLKMEENLQSILDDLKNKKYKHGSYKKIILHDSKKRYIHSPKFRDHIFHHMLYSVLYDVIDKRLIHQTFACRRGFGSHKTILYLKNIVLNYRSTDEKIYYLKIDISKYFYSINHEILETNLFKIIKNDDIRYAIKVFLNSYKSPGIYDYLFDVDSNYNKYKNKGLPIGSIISQLFANFYLSSFDHFIKNNLKVKNYIRYMDDMLFIGTKQELKSILQKVLDFLKDNLYLEINPKKISFNLISDSISFVGYKLINNKIFVGNRIKKGIIKFVQLYKSIDFKDDFLKVRLYNCWQSRRGFFDIADNGESYIKNLNF